MSREEYTEVIRFEVKDKGEGDLLKLYMELGKAYYEGAFEDPLPELLPYFDKITRMRKQ